MTSLAPRLLVSLVALSYWAVPVSVARADFVVETNFSADVKFYNGDAYNNVGTFTGNVGAQNSGPQVTVTTTGNVNTGAGYSYIEPISQGDKNGSLTALIFTPANSSLFSDFSFSGQLTDAAKGKVTVTVQDNQGNPAQTFTFTGLGENADFDRIGIVSMDGETIQSVTISSGGFEEVMQVDFSEANAVPEPASLTMFGLGIVGLVGYGWRRSRRPN